MTFFDFFAGESFLIALLAGVFSTAGVAILIKIYAVNKGWHFKKWLQRQVTKIMESIESETSKGAGLQVIMFDRQRQLSAHISHLKYVILTEHPHLKQDEFSDLFVIISNIEKDTEMKIRADMLFEKGYYERVLREFKKIKWLKIQKERMNWVEDKN